MKNIKHTFLLIVFLLACNAQAQNKETKISDFDNEIIKWKTNLINNRKVGPPCEKNIPKWIKKNPDLYYGMQEIDSSITDFNNDGIKDSLFYLKGINCVGVPTQDSDFGMLIYSKNGESIIDKNITKTIEKAINTFLENTYTFKIDHSKIFYKTFSKHIIGEFEAWKESDASCCPSYTGVFEYNINNENVNLIKIEIINE